MREYWILTKLQLSSLYGINKIRHARDDDSRRKARRSLLALVAMVFGLGWASTVYSMMFASALYEAGELATMLGLMAAATGMLVLVFSVFMAKGVQFGFGDFDTVMSWPVRVQAVVAARVTTMYAYNFIYALLLMLPAGVIYAAYAHPPVWFYPVYLVGMITIPALPTVLGAALGTLMTMLTARMKHKSLASSVGQIALAFGIMALSFSLNSGMTDIADKAVSIGQSLGRIWPPAGWLMRAAQGEVWLLVANAGVAALAMGVFAWLLAKCFLAVNSRLAAVPHAGGKRLRSQRASGAVHALYRMEWKRYVGSSLYLANTAFGYVMLLALAILLGIVRLPAVTEIFGEPSMRRTIPLIASLIVTMSATTYSAISIEGKRLWVVKSLPVTAREWFAAKLLVSVTLAVPTILLFAAITGIGMRFDAREWLFAVVTPVGYALLSGVAGLWINLRLPKFDWTAEAEIVKQSASTMIGVFGGMLAAGVPFAILLITDAPGVLAAATVAVYALSAWLYASLCRSGDEKLYRL